MAGNLNTAPTAFFRLATKFGALRLGPRANKEAGATARDGFPVLEINVPNSQTAQLVKLVNGAAKAGIAVGVKTITDATPTALFDVACPVGSRCGGTLFATIEASDGADHQSMTSLVNYAAVNKAGVLTLTITDLATVDAKAVSAGTLTLAWTLVTGAGKCTVTLQPTGSLVETTYTVTFFALPIVGAVTLV